MRWFASIRANCRDEERTHREMRAKKARPKPGFLNVALLKPRRFTFESAGRAFDRLADHLDRAFASADRACDLDRRAGRPDLASDRPVGRLGLGFASAGRAFVHPVDHLDCSDCLGLSYSLKHLIWFVRVIVQLGAAVLRSAAYGHMRSSTWVTLAQFDAICPSHSASLHTRNIVASASVPRVTITH